MFWMGHRPKAMSELYSCMDENRIFTRVLVLARAGPHVGSDSGIITARLRSTGWPGDPFFSGSCIASESHRPPVRRGWPAARSSSRPRWAAPAPLP